MNSTKSTIGLINSSKNKLNSKKKTDFFIQYQTQS